MDVSVKREYSSSDEPRKVLLENCSVCGTLLHQSRFPQLFPCLHSACSTCLSKQYKEEENKKSIECPSCKRLFGITEIMDNFIFKLAPSPGKGDTKKCGGCGEIAICGWCKQCGTFLCSDCVCAHTRVKLAQHHTVLKHEPSTGSHSTLYCQSHRGESLNFHCVNCDVLTCRSCLLVDHRNHRYQVLSEAVSASRQKLHSLESAVTKQKDQVKQSLLDVDQRLQNIMDMKARLKNNLCWTVYKVYRAMLEKAFQLFQNAKGVYETEEEMLSQKKASLKRMEERQNYVMSFIEKTLSTEDHAVVLLKNRIESQINDLLCQHISPAHCMFEVKLQLDERVISEVENLGKIAIRVVPSAQNKAGQSDSVLERVPNLQNVPSDCINTAISFTFPDSSGQAARLSQSPVVPHCGHNQTSSTKDSFNKAATSTPSPETCAQAALRGQSPTVSSSDASQSQSRSSADLETFRAFQSLPEGPNLHDNAVSPSSSQHHQGWPDKFLSRLCDVSTPHTNHVEIKDTRSGQDDIIDLTCDDSVSTVDTKNSTPTKKTVRHQVDLASSAHLEPSCSLLKVNPNESQDLIPSYEITEKHLVEEQVDWSSDSLLSDAVESRVYCSVCDMNKGTLFCAECERCFHTGCHVPPITTKFILHKWKCSLCQDFSDPTDPFRRDRSRKLCLSSLDQRRCEHLILALMCEKNSCILYLSNKKATSLSVDFEFIHERLLRKRTPPYRTPSELVSDVWLLLDSLQSRTKNIDDILKMQKFFEKRVNQVFGDTLHPSLLTRPTMKRGRDTAGPVQREMSKEERSLEDYPERVIKKRHLY